MNIKMPNRYEVCITCLHSIRLHHRGEHKACQPPCRCKALKLRFDITRPKVRK